MCVYLNMYKWWWSGNVKAIIVMQSDFDDLCLCTFATLSVEQSVTYD